MTPRTYNVPSEPATYLGYPLTITQSHVRVSSPDGREVARVRSLSSARRVVRAERRLNV